DGGFVVKLWDLEAGKERLTLRGHGALVLGGAFAPDGKTLASSGDDRTVKVGDAASGRELGTLQGHTHGGRGVAYPPDGPTLAPPSRDGSVLLWDLHPDAGK